MKLGEKNPATRARLEATSMTEGAPEKEPEALAPGAVAGPGRPCRVEPLEGSAPESRSISMKIAFEKAAEVVVLSAHLYRELALSALSLIPSRGHAESE